MSENLAQERKYNDDELEAPEWLNNKELFTKILCQSENNNAIEIVQLKSTPASFKGDHYGSVTFRFYVQYKQNNDAKSKSIIVKTMPDVEGMKKYLLNDSFVYETESEMYAKVLPRMEKALRAIGDDTELAPRYLYHSLSPKKFIAFEDIVPLGYDVLRERDPSIDEVKIALMKLAKFHAVGHMFVQENPNDFDEIRHGLFTVTNFINSPIVSEAFDRFIQMLETQPDLIQYKPYMEALKPKVVETCIQLSEEYRRHPKPGALYSICHGDFHVRNLMFKNDKQTDEIQDILLLDFQLCYVGLIVYDLVTATAALLTSEMRQNNFDELLFYYFTNFQETLKKLNFKGHIPSTIEFRKQLLDYKYYYVFAMVALLPMIIEMLYGKGEIEEIMQNETNRMNAFMNKKYIDEVRKLLPRYLHMGYLEN